MEMETQIKEVFAEAKNKGLDVKMYGIVEQISDLLRSSIPDDAALQTEKLDIAFAFLNAIKKEYPFEAMDLFFSDFFCLSSVIDSCNAKDKLYKVLHHDLLKCIFENIGNEGRVLQAIALSTDKMSTFKTMRGLGVVNAGLFIQTVSALYAIHATITNKSIKMLSQEKELLRLLCNMSQEQLGKFSDFINDIGPAIANTLRISGPQGASTHVARHIRNRMETIESLGALLRKAFGDEMYDWLHNEMRIQVSNEEDKDKQFASSLASYVRWENENKDTPNQTEDLFRLALACVRILKIDKTPVQC